MPVPSLGSDLASPGRSVVPDSNRRLFIRLTVFLHALSIVV